MISGVKVVLSARRPPDPADPGVAHHGQARHGLRQEAETALR